MRIARIENCALAEFDDAITSVVFFQGCDLNCNFCQNPQLIPKNDGVEMAWNDVSLEINWNYIDWLSLTGGEPLMQDDWDSIVKLCMFAKQCPVKLNIDMNSNLTFEKMKRLSMLAPYLDCVSVDVKNFYLLRPLLDRLEHAKVLSKIRMRCVVTSDNTIPLVERIAVMLQRAGIKQVTMLSNSREGRGAELPETNPSTLGRIHEYYSKFGLDFADAKRKV